MLLIFLQNLVKEIIVTNGSKGSTIFINNEVYNIPAYPTNNLIDPTGAGDTYLAGYMTAVSLFKDPPLEVNLQQ